jgi:hypothetical protein
MDALETIRGLIEAEGLKVVIEGGDSWERLAGSRS